MSNFTWIDVTDFLRWRGGLTGFQHIQYNVAKYYIAKGLPVKFFVYEEPLHRFREVEFDPDSVAQNGKIGDIRDTDNDSSRAIRERLVGVAKRHTPHIAKKAAKRIIRSVRPVTPVAPSSPFSAGDRVVVLGGIWHGSFASDIAREKQAKGFAFYHFVHDMIPVVTPQYVVEDLPGVFEAYKDTIFRIADGLMANSESSKRDALAFMKQRGITPPRIESFRIADQPDVVDPEPVSSLVGQDFILSLGTVEGRKNHALLYYAYKQAAREGRDMPILAIAGRIGWLIDDIRYVIARDPEVKDKIIFLKDVTNGQRAWLLQNSLFSVWPSFYEGWGMPVAESLAYGKVCISSDTSSMPEVGGDLLVYASPFDSAEWLQAIHTYATDKQERQQLEGRIRKEFQVTTWEATARGLADFIAT